MAGSYRSVCHFSEIFDLDLYEMPIIDLEIMMRMNTYYFSGRGKGIDHYQENHLFIRCEEGTVLAIIYTCSGVDFVYAHCRKALMDRWGVECIDPFVRECDPGMTRQWAVPLERVYFFRPMKLEIVAEQEWMRIKR